MYLARLFFKEKKSRYCHHSGGDFVVVGGGGLVVVVVVVVMKFNLGYNFKRVEENIMKLHTPVNHSKGYTLCKTHNSTLFVFQMYAPLYIYAKMDCVLIKVMSMGWHVC